MDSAFTPSNFGKLRVVTAPGHPDADQVFAAGFVEGYLTAGRIADHHHNLYTYFTGTLQVDLDKPMAWWGAARGEGGKRRRSRGGTARYLQRRAAG